MINPVNKLVIALILFTSIQHFFFKCIHIYFKKYYYCLNVSCFIHKKQNTINIKTLYIYEDICVYVCVCV